jgi:hypothetical protein
MLKFLLTPGESGPHGPFNNDYSDIEFPYSTRCFLQCRIPPSNHHRPKFCRLSSSRAVPQQFNVNVVVPFKPKPISVLPCLDLEEQNVWKMCDLELLQCQRSTLQPHPIWNSRPYGSIPRPDAMDQLTTHAVPNRRTRAAGAATSGGTAPIDARSILNSRSLQQK